MSKPNLVLINTIDLPNEELTQEFHDFKESLPEGTQISMFDIIPHDDEHDWFNLAIKRLEEDS